MTETDPAPGTDVAVQPTRMTHGSIAARREYASMLADSSLVPAAYRGKPANVFLAIEYGGMLGVHPLAALGGIHVIEGKPTLSPALMTALIRGAGHRVRSGIRGHVEDGSVVGWCEVTRSDDPERPFKAEWNLARAERAKLVTVVRNADGTVTLTGRQTWTSYTEAMLKARATSEVCREAAEEVLMGAHYTPEELGAVVGEDGEVLEGEVLPDPPARQQQPPTEASPDTAAPAAATPTEDVVDGPDWRGTSEELASIVARGILLAADVAALSEVWAYTRSVVVVQTWAHEHADVTGWAESVLIDAVAHLDQLTEAGKPHAEPVLTGSEVTLLELFKSVGAYLRARATSTPEPAAEPDGSGDDDPDPAPAPESTAQMSPRGVANALGVESALITEPLTEAEERRAEVAREQAGVRTDEPAPVPLAGATSKARENAMRVAREARGHAPQPNTNR